MKKELPAQIFFYTRLLLYMLAFCMPFFHPAIVVSYDAIGFWFWFIIIPAEMFIAFYAAPPKVKLIIWLTTAVLFPLIIMLFVSGFTWDTLMFTAGGIASFLFTVLIFKTKGRGKSIAALEVFLLGTIYFKLLSFSRASSEIADKSYEITKMLLIVSICAFLLHCIVLYLSFFKQKKLKKQGKELIIFFSIVIPLLLLIALALPADFIDHFIELNQVDEDKIPEGVELEDLFDSNGEGEPDETGQPGEGKLEGIEADEWPEGLGSGEGGKGKQYTVMIVASKLDTLYAANEYFGVLDPEQGFVFSQYNKLNELSTLRIIETWNNKTPVYDLRRREQDIFYLSREPYRFLAYEPLSFAPTILNYRFYPLSYSYNTTSYVSSFNYKAWEKVLVNVEGKQEIENELETPFPYRYQHGREANIRELTEYEKEEFYEYLEVPISDQFKAEFLLYLENNVNEKDPYMDRLLSILQGFNGYQYNLGYTDAVNVARIEEFISIEKEGDCTEFSNSTAILARLTGIPSRVVTGYLVSKNFQNPNYDRALRFLKQSIGLLDEFPIEDLILVTTAHRHSWAQVYIPDYGWIDIEATSYAIPPPPGSDPSAMDLVIPIIRDKERTVRPGFEFPWAFALFTLLFLIVGITICLYLYRYSKEAFLFIRFKSKNDLRALKSIYLSMLMKLAASGFIIKLHAKTVLEYSEIYPELSAFAGHYTRLRYNENLESDEKNLIWEDLRSEYQNIIENSKQPGFWNVIKRTVSLRGLLY